MRHFELSQEDAVQYLRRLRSNSVDLCITDPAYESLEKYRAVGTTTRLKVSDGSSNAWFQIFPNSRYGELFKEIYRVLRKNSHLYFFCDSETMFVVKPIAEQAGFKFWKPIVWDKVRLGMGYHYRARYEFVLFFEKGSKQLADRGVADIIDDRVLEKMSPEIIECSRVNKGYPTEKPPGVADVLVRQSSQPGDLVLDPFMGSGSTGVAALCNDRSFIGTDIADASLALAHNSLLESYGEQAQITPWEMFSKTTRYDADARCANCGKTWAAPRNVPDEWQCDDCGALIVQVGEGK